ncbi:MAG: hypothetical protein M0Q26_13525 [Chitinophagaceae bacterium]|nr:hypothetical protein [Chitinophagaceae bacterium]
MSNLTVFGTKEWAPQSANIVEGCSNNCKYCYAREMAVRFGRREPDKWNMEVYRADWASKKYNPTNGRIMFPSTHDITKGNLSWVIQFLSRILEAGNEVLIVTKPQPECIKSICDSFRQYRDKIMFRFTIGSLDDRVLSFWEPGASKFTERLLSIQYAYFNGYKTSVSCEPMLDGHPELLAEVFLPYVTDAMWFGKPNFLIRRLSRNGFVDNISYKAAMTLQQTFSDDFIHKLFCRYESNPKIKWKESIKKVLNISIPEEIGLDV